MSAAERNREAANEIARRAIEAAERRQQQSGLDPESVERLRRAAGADGSLNIEDAIAALSPEREPWNPFAGDREHLEANGRADAARLFPSASEPEPDPPPATPQGSADGGEGEGPKLEFDQTADGQRFQVFDLDQLNREDSR